MGFLTQERNNFHQLHAYGAKESIKTRFIFSMEEKRRRGEGGGGEEGRSEGAGREREEMVGTISTR